MARLNKQLDIHFKTHYKVAEYNIKQPQTRVPEITPTPYGYRKWVRRKNARKLCIKNHMTLTTSHIPLVEARTTTKRRVRRLFFDADLFPKLVDNCCSKSITNNIKDFIGPPKNTMTKIKGYNGLSTKPLQIGMVKWPIRDDKGKVHQFIPDAETRLFSPQHWAQALNNGRQTNCITYHDAIILQWDNGRYKKTIPISQHTNNVAMMTTAPGITAYKTFCTQISMTHPDLAYPTTIELPDVTIITDDEADELQMDHPTKATKIQDSGTAHGSDSGTILGSMQLQSKTNNEQPIQVTYKEPEYKDTPELPTYNDEKQEYMKWHYKLNHASLSTMQRMAQRKLLPHFITKILRKIEKTGGKAPMCNDCYSASACKTQWRYKTEKKINMTGQVKMSKITVSSFSSKWRRK